MNNEWVVAWIERFHVLIYVIMFCAMIFTLYCSLVGYFGWPLYVALVLLTIEGVALALNRCQCPLTTLSEKYGADKSFVFDGFLSERASRLSFPIYIAITMFSLLLLVWRLFN